MVVVDTEETEEYVNDETDHAVFDDAGPYDAQDDDQTYYITAAWGSASEVPSSLVVGDESTTVVNGETYLNARLRSNTEYAIFYRVEVMSDTNEVS